MNIFMIHPHDIYSPLEPWTVRVKKLAMEFAAKGHKVTLAYFPLDSSEAGKIKDEGGIRIVSLDRRLGAIVLFKNIARVVRLSSEADVIHFQKCYYYAALPALVASVLKDKPLHYDWDDWETKIFYYSNPRQRMVGEFLNIFERLIPRAVDTVSVSSDHLRGLSMRLGVKKANIFSAPVGADLGRFNQQVMAKFKGGVKGKYGICRYLVMYLGQLHGGQYAELFINAAASILKTRKDVHFMIIGDGYRLGELKELARSSGALENFIFTGFVPHDEIPAYLADADVCVACFEDNNITRCKSPLKIVEYLACGKAIAASNVGEVRNMVGGTGVLTEPGDHESLSKGILLLLDDERLRDSLGKSAAERARRKYNWRSTAANLLDAYDMAIRLKKFS